MNLFKSLVQAKDKCILDDSLFMTQLDIPTPLKS